jgi:tRNA 2-thiouridine synthesizing protein A
VLTVLADDPLAAVDIPHMCHTHGHAVETVSAAPGHHVFRIRRGPQAGPDSLPAPGG